jgi:hypothetical protein
MRTKQFTASNDVTFTVIALAPGEVGPNPYRKSDTHTLVEFHDARYAEGHEDKPSQFTEHGQFVSYYRLADIIDGVSGIMLDTGSSNWRIDADTMNAIRAWLTSRTLAERIAEDAITNTATTDGNLTVPPGFASASSAYTVTLHRGTASMSVPFFMGPAHTEPPTTADVLEVLLSDASGYINARSFGEWADEFGFDPETDARGTWKRTYEAIKRATDALRVFLGEKFEDYLWHTDQP